MTRLPKFIEQKILLRNIKALVSFFERTVFKISDIASIGGTQRQSVEDGPFFRDISAIVETLQEFEGRGLVKLINYEERNFGNNEFEVIIDNIGDIKPFRTHNDILSDMRNFSDDYLGNNYPGVRGHLRNAEKILYDTKKEDYSDVGHYCQLAYEDFLELVCKNLSIDTSDLERKGLTNDRFERIANKLQEKKQDRKWLELLKALGHFRGCSSDFNEKVEHRGTKNNSTFDEAKKGFLYTFLVINEIHSFVEKNIKRD